MLELLQTEQSPVTGTGMSEEAEDAMIQLACALDGTQRHEALEEVCGTDAELHERLSARIEESAGGETGEPGQPLFAEAAGSSIGPYTLVCKLGQGGMGTVWEARQERPVRRTVALKILKPGMDSAEVVARFDIERQALAMMDHPYIAQVYEAGTTSSGRPYFVMELVRGVPVTQFCDERFMSPEDRMKLFIDICHGLSHAHQKGVIHRDIKPSNILVAEHSGQPVPKLIDFGIAKATDESLTDRTLHTRLGQMIGTPAYMSPEQAAGEVTAVDTRTDIYALGVLLYELLTGSTPIDGRTLRKAGQVEMQRMLVENEPPRPSTRLNTMVDGLENVARGRGVSPPARLGRLLRGDLDWIVMRALEKDPERRYPTVDGFLQDAERYLRSEPVEASPPSFFYRARKFARRNRSLMRASGLVAALLVVGLVVATVGRIRAERHEADLLFESLFRTRSDGLPALLTALQPHRSYLEDRLEAAIADPERSARDRARARLALAPVQPAPTPEVTEWLLSTDPDELDASLKVLGPRKAALTEEILPILRNSDQRPSRRMRAAAIATAIDPDLPDLSMHSPELAGWLTARNSVETARWLPLFAPLRDPLDEPLRQLFRAEQDDPAGEAAATALAEFHGDDPVALAALVRQADPDQLNILSGVLARTPQRAGRALRDELAGTVDTDAPLERARLAIALLLIEQPAAAWPHFANATRPELRTALIHQAARHGVDWRLLRDHLEEANDSEVVSGVLLALGEYSLSRLPLPERGQLRSSILEPLYVSHPDAGVRGAARWLTTRWLADERGFRDQLDRGMLDATRAAEVTSHFAALDADNRRDQPDGSRNWFRTSKGDFTMRSIRGPRRYTMGTMNGPRDEAAQSIVLSHSFAIATTEVPRALFEEFTKEMKIVSEDRKARREQWAPHPECPVPYVSWHEAAMFCSWFTAREGLSEREQCYDIDWAGGTARLREDWIERGGYRLPTEAEWEFACRAGTTTTHFFGESGDHLPHYAWCEARSTEERVTRVPALLRPNPFGLFDILGNGSEWCLEPYTEPYRYDPDGWPEQFASGRAFERGYRGGSFYHLRPHTRSAWRSSSPESRYLFSSFRLAATVTTP